MAVKIKRIVLDLGNSFTFGLVDGDIKNVIEIPTVVKSLEEEQALGFFAGEDILAKDLRKSLLIKYEGKYYLIGDAAERETGNDKHIRIVHKKSQSLTTILTYLATVAVYEAENHDVNNSVDIEIDYLSTMLPIFELLQAEKFSDITEPTAKRFRQPVSFEVITPGRQKKINIHVTQSKCYAEGFVAKFALKYDLKLNEKEEVVQKFRDNKTVNVDLGGGTIDMVLLREALGNPLNRDAFRTITNQPYLQKVVKVLTAKLIEYFQHDRERGLERFIVNHYKEDKYIWENSITGDKVDLTEIIDKGLRQYTKVVMDEILDTYEAIGEERYKFNYYGGVAPILRKYIKEYITDRFSIERFNEYHHIEPDKTARFLNLYGLEVLARQDTLVTK